MVSLRVLIIFQLVLVVVQMMPNRTRKKDDSSPYKNCNRSQLKALIGIIKPSLPGEMPQQYGINLDPLFGTVRGIVNTYCKMACFKGKKKTFYRNVKESIENACNNKTLCSEFTCGNTMRRKNYVDLQWQLYSQLLDLKELED